MRKIFTIMVAAFAAIAMNAEPITVAEALEAGSTLQDGELTEQESDEDKDTPSPVALLAQCHQSDG